MKVISQLATHFRDNGRLTPEQVEALSQMGLLPRRKEDGRAPEPVAWVSVEDSKDDQDDPFDAAAERLRTRDGRRRKEDRSGACVRRAWAIHLGLLPAARPDA
jgi:hypothetical protein